MTLKMLREAVAAMDPELHDFKEVQVWLPGSYIDLTTNRKVFILAGDRLLIEGNLAPGSALEDQG